MIVHIVDDPDLASAIVNEGNFDDVVSFENEKLYIKYGTNKVWIVRPSENKTYILHTSFVDVARRRIESIIRTILNKGDLGSIGKISMPLF